jgi:hypothetical protein
LQRSILVGGPWVKIIGEGDVVADEHIVFDHDTFTNEGMAGNFAIAAHGRIFLNFHKCSDGGVVANFAPVEIYIVVSLYISAEYDIAGYGFHDMRQFTAICLA